MQLTTAIKLYHNGDSENECLQLLLVDAAGPGFTDHKGRAQS